MKTTKNARRFLSVVLLMAFIQATLGCGVKAAANEAEVSPRYTGMSLLAATLDISFAGRASCYGYARILSGYSADLAVELQQDGETIKTWTSSGTKEIEILKDYWVAPGYDYQVIATATVKDSSGLIVDISSIDSQIITY